MSGYRFPFLFNFASSWNSRSGLLGLPPARRGVVRKRSASGGSCRERKTEFFKEILSSECDSRHEKRCSKLPCSTENITEKRLWLNYQHKSKSLGLSLVNPVQQTEYPRNGVQGLSQVEYTIEVEDFKNLCKEGDLDKALDILLHLEQWGVVSPVRMYVCFLKECGKWKRLLQAKRAHAQYSKLGLDSSSLQFLSECTVSTLVRCGGLKDALDVFNNMPQQTSFSWTALISGYGMCGQAKEALTMYQRMQEKGVQPNAYTFVSLLRACGRLRDLEEGKRMHAEAVKHGLEFDLYVRTCLVDMYGKCGSTEDARHSFDGLSQPDVVSWNAMLAAYVQQGEAENALKLYGQMQEDGGSPNTRTFVSCLQACGILAEKEIAAVTGGCCVKVKCLETGRNIHADAGRKGCDNDVFIVSTLISMYGKCGSVADARKVFDGLLHPTVVAWNAMIGVYIEQGQAEEALQLYEKMKQNFVSPDNRTFVSALQACGMLAENEMVVRLSRGHYLEKGRAIHADIQRKGFDSDVFVRSSLVSMYGKCSSVGDAQDVFDRLSHQDVVSWNAMIAAYAQQAQAGKALELYEKMLEDGVSPTVRTCVSALQACGMLADEEEYAFLDSRHIKLRSLGLGRALHAYTRTRGFDSDVFIGNTLVSMYGKCGRIEDAQRLFDMLSNRDLVTWNAMLASYVEQDQPEKALHIYERLLEEGKSPDAWTIVGVLQAYCMLVDAAEQMDQLQVENFVGKGKAVNAYARIKGYQSDLFLGNALISLYGKCGSIVDAKSVFNRLPQQDVVAWNVMLASYVEQGQGKEALNLYELMLENSVSQDAWTFVGALQACGMVAEQEVEKGHAIKVKSFQEGRALHEAAQRKGLDLYVFVSTTLISMYGKCGSIVDAQIVFDRLSQKEVAAWNAMLAAFAHHGLGENALQLWSQMQEHGVVADEITVVCVLQACSSTGSLAIVRHIHDVTSTTDHWSPLVASALISAYGRCASMEDARVVFDALPKPQAASWNALIAGYAREGNYVASLQCYEEMQRSGVQPNKVTFLSILSTCSHAGLVDEGLKYFESMGRDFGIVPEIQHYGSMADMFGRAGCLKRVEELLSSMPMLPNLPMWLCLLAACQKHGMVEQGKRAFDNAVRLQPSDGAAYVLMSNIYADAGLWEYSKEVDALRQQQGAQKTTGCSWIELGQGVHNFVVGDETHVQQAEVYNLLKTLNSPKGLLRTTGGW